MRTALALWLAAGAIAACGGPTEPARPPPSAPGAATAAPPASGTAPPPAASAAPTATTATSAAKPGPSAPAKIPAATAMAGQLSEIGLDVKALPPLNKLTPEQLRKVMKTFASSLGVKCDGCHDTRDFRATTPQKKIATHMWNDFTRVLATADGAPVYCDSCHGGHAEFLDRHDKRALSTWMQDNYVDKLKRVDNKDHGCETCHGDPMEPKIFAKLWK
jgi:hypothetical protein